MTAATRTFTLLGTGSSGGVPRVGNDWGACDPAEPRNRRRRCAMLVEQLAADGGKTSLLIDAGADLREQLLASGVQSLEAVLLTHAHADHIHGLDDLRQLAINLRRSIDVYLDDATAERVMQAFGYCFTQADGSSYPAFCTAHRMAHPWSYTFDGPGGGIDVRTLEAEHGDIHALGVRIGDVVYLPDVKRISDPASLRLLDGVDTLVVDALRRQPHPTHMNLDESLRFIEQVGPRRAILTNMHCDLDFQTLVHELPASVEPGHDGLVIAVPDAAHA